MTSPRRPPVRRSRLVVAALGVAVMIGAAACSGGGETGTPAPAPSSQAPAGPINLTGWKLTVPAEDDDGDAKSVEPAALTSPWLDTSPDGGLEFWAPSAGATTKNSDHSRTELVSRSDFSAGKGTHTLTASVTLLQVPDDGQGIILGQIHGAGDIKSVPYVMLRYQDQQVRVVVKQVQDGDQDINYPLLDNVGLNTRIDFTLSDPGNGSLEFTATSGGQTRQATAPIPSTFTGETVRFQAGDYQLADAPSGAQDGGRVVFHQLAQQPDPA
jgi:alginate lyase